MSGSSIRKSIATRLRTTGDLWYNNRLSSTTESSSLQLIPSKALQVVDHHLHASGLIPRIHDNSTSTSSNNGKRRPPRIYEHDWFCVSQSIRCYAIDEVLEQILLLEEQAVNDVTANNQMMLPHSHTWVDSIGHSSIQFGNMITMNHQVLATVRRCFVRKTSDGASAPFSIDEKEYLLVEGGIDEGILEYMGSDDDLDCILLPPLEKYGTFMPLVTKAAKDILLTVPVGPQHVNMGDHADHAFLAETAIHAMLLSSKTNMQAVPNTGNSAVVSIGVQYIAEAKLGDELECTLHDDRVLISRRRRRRSSSTKDEEEKEEESPPVLVLVAKALV